MSADRRTIPPSEQQARETALRMALEYYADEQQYRIVAEQQTRPMILSDHGKRARHALQDAGQRGADLHRQFVKMGRRIFHQKRKLAEQEAEIARLRAALRKLLPEFEDGPGPLARWMEHVARKGLGDAAEPSGEPSRNAVDENARNWPKSGHSVNESTVDDGAICSRDMRASESAGEPTER